MTKWKHRVSNVDESSRLGDCSHCGRVRVYRHGARWSCSTADRERQRDKKSRHHGLTQSEAQAMKRSAKCEICGSIEDLKIDHDHASGAIRGVLCHHCNVAIGHMRDSPERLRAAADYLEK